MTSEEKKVYSKEYRKKHPEYVLRDREKSKIRAKINYYILKEKYPDRFKKLMEHKNRKKRDRGKYRFSIYKSQAKKRKKDFVLTKEQFEKIINGECYYCGTKNKIGIDRKDNSKGYTIENSVSCCRICNWMKLTLTEKEFIQHCIEIANNSLQKPMR